MNIEATALTKDKTQAGQEQVPITKKQWIKFSKSFLKI